MSTTRTRHCRSHEYGRGGLKSIADAVIALHDNDSGADEAVKELPMSGSDMKKLTVLGKDRLLEDQVISSYSAGDGKKHGAKPFVFWGRIWGFLFGAAFLWVPGMGPLFWVAARWWDGSLQAARKVD